uniref:C-type lectin domain-containing protein n=2 Tax=Myripristis murdjan TaxID=586833 RepID=A0A667YN53_9TELE
MSMIRSGPNVRHYRLAAVSLGLLAVLLLTVDIGLGVYYNKLTDGNLYPYSGITRITSELTKLKLTYKVTTEAVAEAKKLVAKEIAQQEQTKWHLEQRKRSGDDYKVQMDKLQREIASLQSTIPLIRDGCRHCLPGWVFMNSKCYYFTFSNTFTRRSWQEARDNCKRQGADLAVIDSMEKQLAVSALLNDRAQTGLIGGFWIGLKDDQEEGTWRWLDGTVLAEGFWNDGEPNDSGHNEDCAATYPRANPAKSWNDAPCQHTLKWICEMPPLTVS